MTHATPKWWVQEVTLTEYFSHKDRNKLVVTSGFPEAAEIAKSHIWKKYDYVGLKSDVLEWVREDDDSKYYCSELIADVLQMKNDVITPDDIIAATTPLYVHWY